MGAEGNMRSPSSITAVMYGSLTSSSNEMSASDLKVSRISAVRRSRMYLFSGRSRRLNRPARKPAVVSVPAMLGILGWENDGVRRDKHEESAVHDDFIEV